MVRHNLLGHGKTGNAELVLDIGHTLEAEIFGARKEFAHILRTHTEASGEVGSFQSTVIIGLPKNVESMARVDIVKLCSPLNQRVISLDRFPRASANCFFIQTLFLHKRVQSVRDSKRESGFLPFLLRYHLIEDFL